jgi:hypothetical protein
MKWKTTLIVMGVLLIGIIGGMIYMEQQQIINLFPEVKEQRTSHSSFDPNDTRLIGSEFLDEGKVVHIWNIYDDYFFNRSSGIQFTNHYENYWTKNIFCIGYYSGSSWNKIKCADELENFNRSIKTDNETYVNATLWKDITYSGYDMRLGVQYHLELEDGELSIMVYGKNIGVDIPFDLGFAWKIKDVEIPGDDDTILINETDYDLDGTYDLMFKNLNETQIEIHNEKKYLWMDWKQGLNYAVKVYGDGNQENFYTMLLINAGHFNPNQEKSTTLHWIDADVQVDSSVQTTTHGIAHLNSLVWINSTKGYIFFADGSQNLHYRITTDSGATWTTEGNIHTGTIQGFAIWYDRWTPNDTGTEIHVVYSDSSDDDLFYNSLNTSDDVLGGEVTIHSWTSVSTTENWGYHEESITKSRGGRLYVGAWGDNSEGSVFYNSSDGSGSSWTSRTTMGEINTPEPIMFHPGDEIDDNDIWSIFIDRSTDQVSLKIYDQSEDTWSETVFGEAERTNTNTNYMMDSATRHLDNHVILVVEDYASDPTINNMTVYDIGGSGDITRKANVTTAVDDNHQPSIMINQQNDDIYVSYIGKEDDSEEWGGTVKAYYKLSQDGGDTWGPETSLSENAADDLRWITSGTSVVKEGGRFQPVWFNDDLNDLFTTTVNSIETGGTDVEWNASEIDLSESTNNITSVLEISSLGENTNTVISCSGNCTEITTNWTQTTMSNRQVNTTLITCSNATDGEFQAIFNVTSDEDTTPNSLIVNCEIFSYGWLNVSIEKPDNNSSYSTGDTNLTLNSTVTCMGKPGRTGARCGTVSALGRYNLTANPDTTINVTEGGEPFYVIGSSELEFTDYVGVSTGNDDDYPNTTVQTPSSPGANCDNSNIWSPNSDPASTTTLTDAEYTNISTNDGSNYTITEEESSEKCAVFHLNISEDASEFNISWTGYGDSGDSLEYIKIWNETLGDWSTLDDTISSVRITQKWSFSNLSAYLNKSAIHILASGGGSVGGKTGGLHIDYLNISFFGLGASNPQSLSMNQGDVWQPNWTMNVTSTTAETYLLDVEFNSSYGSALVADNDTGNRLVNLNVGGAPSPDSCAYDSGNWEVDMSDNCVTNSTITVGGDITFTNTGTFTINSTVSANNMGSLASGQDIIIGPNCSLII